MRRRLLLCGCIALCASLLCCSRSPELTTGPWRAWLDSPGGELPFGLELSRQDGELQAALINGTERIAVPRVERNGTELILSIDHYDSAVVAVLSPAGSRLDGEWTKTAGPDGKRSRLAFHATAGQAPRFAPRGSSENARGEIDRGSLQDAPGAIDGRWLADFDREDDPAVAIFETGDDGTVHGTFLTTTGDYRYLAGSFEEGRLRLSCFDGAHAFLFDATLREDGTLAGDFWSRDSWHDTWTARREPEAALPDPFAQTSWTGAIEPAEIVFPDLDGNPRSLADPEFAGKARIVELFGSWCPNCNDAAVYLAELDRRYRDRGLSIVGLAFEMTGEFERDADQVRKYKAHHGVEFPILLAGLSDKDEASATFTAIDRVRSYPTMIFIDAEDNVRAVYSGYSGPATGEAHIELREQFETLIERMLSER